MVRTQIYLTEKEHKVLRSISVKTGKSQSELIREAIDQLVCQFEELDRKKLLKQARGIWQDRQDLPDLKKLRREWERF